MKKILYLTFALTILTLSSRALDYHHFPDSNAAWQIRFWIGPGYPFVYSYYYMDSINNDTTINGHIYGKLYYVTQGPFTSYMGALRDNDSAQVYFYPKDSAQEYLLFDYSKNVGDTIYDVFGFDVTGPTTFNPVVLVKDSVLIAGRYQRHLQLSTGINWVEGVCTDWGLLENINTGVSGSTILVCMSREDTTWWQGGYALGACSLILANVPEELLGNSFILYPNPIDDSFTIISNTVHPGSTIEIYNTVGAKIHSEILNKTQQTISCKEFPQGIYFVNVLVEGKQYANKLVVKHN